MFENRSEKKGYLYTLGAFILWGILPVFWKMLGDVPPAEVLSHRIVWSFVFLAAVTVIARDKRALELLKSRTSALALGLTSILIAVNWFTYIAAVGSGYIIEASLGYYINPLVNILLGTLFLKERLNKYQAVSLVLAFAGVLYMAVDYGRIPWIALILAFTFGLYGLFKKKFDFPSLPSLFIETLYLVIPSIAFLIYSSAAGAAVSLSGSWKMWILLCSSGIVTSVPLYLFAKGAKRIPLIVVGFFQYIGPTLMLAIGILGYGEEFTLKQGISFGFIWLGLIVFTFSLRENRKKQTQPSE